MCSSRHSVLVARCDKTSTSCYVVVLLHKQATWKIFSLNFSGTDISLFLHFLLPCSLLSQGVALLHCSP